MPTFDVDFSFRDFVRVTPQHPAPIGDPTSGVHNPTKRDLRELGHASLDAAVQAQEAAEAAIAAMLDVQGATMYASNLTSLLANTSPSYPAGTVFATRAEGFSYSVVSADPDLTTAGGVGLRALPKDGMFNVKAFGAVGDGAATDTGAVQAAIAAGQAQGLAVFIPAGEFNIGAFNLAITAPVVLHGTGPASKLVRNVDANSATTPVLQVANTSGVVLKNFLIDGGYGSITTAARGLVVLNCSNLVIEGVEVIKCVNRGIYFLTGQDGVAGTTSVIKNCVVRGGSVNAIEVEDSSNVLIDGNRVENVLYQGIRVYGSAAGAARNISIVNNLVVNAKSGGIAVPLVAGGTTETSGVWDITVSGNNVSGSESNGINVQARSATVTGNVSTKNGTLTSHQGILINAWDVTVQGNVSRDNAGVGIDFGDCKRVLCAGNIVVNNALLGIEINSTEDFVVTGNLLYGNNAGSGAVTANKAAGILVHKGSGGYPFQGDTLNGVVANNVVRAGPHQQFGISIEANCRNVRILGNDAQSSGSVRDFNIQAASGEFITDTNNVARETFTSANTLTIKQVGKFFTINAGPNLQRINLDGGTAEIGREIILRFTGAVTVESNTGNLFLEGNTNFVANNGSMLHLVRVDAGSWMELSRRS